MAIKYVIGIDEVGRGPLAGPVVVAALAIKKGFNIKRNKSLPKLKDSKKLSVKARELWFDYIKNSQKIFYKIARVYPKMIDRINISNAANLAACRACQKLIKDYKLKPAEYSVLLDGGLYLKSLNFQLKNKNLIIKTIIKGDEKIPAIALASIAAKVSRDKLLKKYAEKFKNYRFDSHKGYGTKFHIKAIKKHGVAKIHRLTFLKNL